MLTVREIGLSEAAGMRTEWNSLVASMPFPSFFCTWEWIFTWWEEMAGRREPLILGVCRGSRLAGILPLALRRVCFRDGAIVGRILEFSGDGAYPDHLDLIAAQEDAEECLDALALFLRQGPVAWDVLSFSHLSRGSSLGRWSQFNGTGGSGHSGVVTTAPYLSLKGSFADYARDVLGGRGATIRRKRRRLADLGLVYQDAAALDENAGLAVLFDLHRKRSTAKGIASTFDTSSALRFHGALLRRVKGTGWHFARYVGDGGRWIAALYGFVFANRLLYFQSGHDPRFDSLSPGAVVMYSVIEEAFEREVEEFDFLRGAERYKRLWTNTGRELLHATAFNSTPCGLLSSLAFRARRRLKGVRGRFRPVPAP